MTSSRRCSTRAASPRRAGGLPPSVPVPYWLTHASSPPPPPLPRPQGLFTAAELDPENVKERDAKVAFLDKLITCVALHLGTHCAARSGKIVAGAEPERTNELLQVRRGREPSGAGQGRRWCVE